MHLPCDICKTELKKRKTSLSDISFEVPLPCMQISHFINNLKLNIEKASSHLQAFSVEMNY